MKVRARAANRKAPRFPTEDEERRFWAGHDTVDFFDWVGGRAGAPLVQFSYAEPSRDGDTDGARGERAFQKDPALCAHAHNPISPVV